MTSPTPLRGHKPALLPLGALLAVSLTGAGFAQAQQSPAPDKTLPTIEVIEQRIEDAVGYQARTSTIGKVPQALRDIPQSVTVVTGQLIQDRNADTLKEALRNVAGLTFNAGEGGRIGDNVTLRGYSLVGDLYLDGMRDIAQYNREVFNVQRVDVLRGAASMLFGRGSTGGVVNQVSKTPLAVDRNEAALTVGSDAYKRATVDLNKTVGKNAAVRLNLMKTDTDSFRDGVSSSRWGFAPSFAWGLGTNDEFSLSYYRLKGEGVPDFGVPYFQGKPFEVPTNRFYGMANFDFQREDSSFKTASYTHYFEDDSKLKTTLRKADYDRDLWAVAPRLATPLLPQTDSSVMNRQRQARGGVEHTLTSQTDYSRGFATGKLQHQLLAGMELVQEDANRWNYLSAVPNPPTTVGNPNPYPVLPAGYGARSRTGEVSYNADTVGLYLQDFIDLGNDWKVLVGARHDSFTADYARPAPAGNLKRTDNVWSYRTGLLYQPTKTVSWYASWGTSFNPSGELYALDDRTTNTPPEKNRNIEIGAKWDVLNGDLSLRTALFRSEKTNERNTDLANTTLSQNLLSGRRHTDGIEFEASGRLTSKWELFSGLALMHATVDEALADQSATIGKRPINTPDYTANIWSTYKVADHWKLGGGVEASGKRYGNGLNTNAVPSYVRADAMLEYERKNYSVKLNVFNLFNTTYYEGVYAGHSVPGINRSAQLTLATKF